LRSDPLVHGLETPSEEMGKEDRELFSETGEGMRAHAFRDENRKPSTGWRGIYARTDDEFSCIYISWSTETGVRHPLYV
jgi:hypothetical protein